MFLKTKKLNIKEKVKFIEKLINQSCSLNNKRQKHKAGRDEGRRLKQENSQEGKEREGDGTRALTEERETGGHQVRGIKTLRQTGSKTGSIRKFAYLRQEDPRC